MNFDFSEEQLVLRDQARKFLSERAAPSRVRRILETDAPYDTELWRGMVEMAWPGTAIPERYGGAGYGYLELCVIAEELGRSLAPTPFSSSVYLATEAILLAGSAAQQTRWLPHWRPARSSDASRWPKDRRPAVAPKRYRRAWRMAASTASRCRWRTGMWPIRRRRRTRGDGRGRCSLVLVDLRAAGVTAHAVATFDPTRSHASIVFTNAAAEPLGEPARLAPRGALARSGRRALRVRAGRRSPGRSRHGARVRAGTLCLRATYRVVPGHQAQARGYLRGPRAGPLERLLRRVGPLDRRAPSCRWPPPPRGSAPARPSSSPPRRTSRPTAAWASRGSSTATCTTAGPSCSPCRSAVAATGRTFWSRASTARAAA